MSYPKGVLGRPAHETKCDVGGSHGGKTNSEKAPNRTDAVAAFQKSQDEKPNNKMDTTLSPGAVTKLMHPISACKGAHLTEACKCL